MANPFPANFEGLDGSRRLTGQVNFTDPGNQPGGGVTPPVTLAGTDPLTVPLNVEGAAAQQNGVGIFRVRSNDSTNGLLIAGDGANSIGVVQLNGPNFAKVALTPNGPTEISADTNTVIGGFGDGLILTQMNAAPADAALSAGDLALWFDSTNGASKLMIKAKSANGTVVSGFVVLA